MTGVGRPPEPPNPAAYPDLPEDAPGLDVDELAKQTATLVTQVLWEMLEERDEELVEAAAARVTELLEERGLVAPAGPPPLLTAQQVAERLNRNREWVYEHGGSWGRSSSETGQRRGSASTPGGWRST
jgi:hypothetical protein